MFHIFLYAAVASAVRHSIQRDGSMRNVQSDSAALLFLNYLWFFYHN